MLFVKTLRKSVWTEGQNDDVCVFKRKRISVDEALVWTVENVSKLECGHESIEAFSVASKKRTFENALVWTGC